MIDKMVMACCAALAAAFAAVPSAEASVDTLSVSRTGDDGSRVIELSVDEIRTMGADVLDTPTDWTEGVQHFIGVTGADFVAALDIEAETVTARAVNNYEVVIPFDVFAAETTLIAYERNGAPMTVRDKGPFWVVFPFHSIEFQTDEYRTYAIWSLTSVAFD